jgi:hypothetical protein
VKDRAAAGQALVEFALVIPLLVLLIAATIDMGRGIYLYNGVSQAVREIARTDSLHACDTKPCSIGTSSSTAATVSTQRSMVPGMGTPTFSCIDIDGSAVATACTPGYLVKVTAIVSFSPIMGLIGTWSLQSSSSVEIP